MLSEITSLRRPCKGDDGSNDGNDDENAAGVMISTGGRCTSMDKSLRPRGGRGLHASDIFLLVGTAILRHRTQKSLRTLKVIELDSGAEGWPATLACEDTRTVAASETRKGVLTTVQEST
jgi:hypothetical protein